MDLLTDLVKTFFHDVTGCFNVNGDLPKDPIKLTLMPAYVFM